MLPFINKRPLVAYLSTNKVVKVPLDAVVIQFLIINEIQPWFTDFSAFGQTFVVQFFEDALTYVWKP